MDGKKILMTGGFGFIGSNFINYLIDNYDNFKLLNLDYKGVGSNIKNVKDCRTKYQEIYHIDIDISLNFVKNREIEKLPFDYLFNFAAESHVDRSISTPEPFIYSNVMGVMQMLELSRKMGVERVIHVSTDEVVGSVNKPAKETAKYNPSSIYSATKASSEMIVNAYIKMYGMDVVITRCANNYGKNQYEDKLIPKVITNALVGDDIPVYDKGEQIREWVHVDDHVKDIITVAKHGKSGQIYNVGGGYPMSNIDLVKKILDILGKSDDIIKFVPNARLGHDFKYSIDISKLNKLKNKYNIPIIDNNADYFTEKLKETIKYYEESYNRRG